MDGAIRTGLFIGSECIAGPSAGGSIMTSVDHYRVPEGGSLDLATTDTRDTAVYPAMSKAESRGELARLRRRLSELQRVLWADGGNAFLFVLQAMDTGGKDGTIRKVLSGVNPQGVDVTGFGVPTELERSHDYLWRVHARTPAKGRIGVFNRSHYEDVLVVRVNELVPESQWSRRYAHIRAFEERLVDEGTTIRKVMLHISKDEQRARLESRLEDPTKNYKFNPNDLDARSRWDDYMAAYEDAMSLTSTEVAPWYVVPADRKWYRNLVVARILVETLESLDLRYPNAEVDLGEVVIT
jgi:PPK2 family polyphosphate:nucleotide phosphotransferase